jgi:hypothetical protein
MAAKVIDFETREQQIEQHVSDDYFKPSEKFCSMDGKHLSEHEMMRRGYEPITIPGKIIKAIVSPLGYACGILLAIIIDIKDGTLLDWFI